MPTIHDLLIREDGYARTMEETVQPYLAARRAELWPERLPGKKIHLMRYRADEPKAAVVFSHGFTEAEEKYAELIYYFLNMGYTVYFPEHCGHGYSYRMTDDDSLVHIDSFDTYIQDLLFVSHLAKAERPGLPLLLFAHSMGGGVGAAAAAREPKLYGKVLLHSPMIRPLTAGIPWWVTKVIVALTTAAGMGTHYIFGSKPYGGIEDFDTSCAMSRPRFDWYQQKRAKNPRLQTSAGSLNWLRGTMKLNRELMEEDWRKIEAPVLLLQAEKENMVSKEEQERFAEKLKQSGKAPVEFAVIQNAKHEIFNSTDDVLEPYLEKVFAFFAA